MMVLLIALLVVVIALVVGVVTGRLDGTSSAVDTMDAPTRTSAFELPAGRLGSAGADQIKIDQALRGYNMVQTDAVLDKLFGEIKELEDHIAALSQDGQVTSGRGATSGAGAEPAGSYRVGQVREFPLHRRTEPERSDASVSPERPGSE